MKEDKKMGNYENIRPYAEFSRTAKEHGGVDNYLNELQTASYDAGASDTLQTVVQLAPFVIGGCLGLWEGGKWICRKVSDHFAKCKEADKIIIESAKEAIKEEVRKEELREEKESIQPETVKYSESDYENY